MNKEELKILLDKLEDICTSMQFSAPENMYIFIEEFKNLLGEIELTKFAGVDKE